MEIYPGLMQGDRLEKFPNSPRSEVINPIMNVNSTETEKWDHQC